MIRSISIHVLPPLGELQCEGGPRLRCFRRGLVVSIAAANPDFAIIMQWTGGHPGGHHSFEDFHQPVLATCSSIRHHDNIARVAGSGFGGSGDMWLCGCGCGCECVCGCGVVEHPTCIVPF